MNNELLFLVVGLILSALLVRTACSFFPRIGLLDFPQRYGLKRARIPYPGGIIHWLLAVIFFLFFPELWFLSVALFLLGGVSVWDDRSPIAPSLRGAMHAGLAAFVFANGIRIGFVGNPFASGSSINLAEIPLLSFILTVSWIVIIQNALNWFDGIKGLSTGVSGIGFLTLGVFGLIRPEVAWESGLPIFLSANFFFAGVCLGGFLFFLRGKILLGDTGSQVLGFLLAVLSIFAGTKIATTLLVLGLPILDVFFVIVRRIFFEKKSPLSGDTKHLHHNLARKIGERKAALMLIGLSAVLGMVGLFLVGVEKLGALLVAIFAIVALSVWAAGDR
ncbi:undecaprenyl/decaprenyl-phosphate alpha-N-acetylglucosaminyl 1-phosphate transferase [Candidatus Gracilibacteria bacterium]|nr:undecaprenyl/decaprenyl-phosphate alpha-N-acetylglucosaminyl 1-phosphate transferase [Candidatus Gracilibacteria bacterium]